MVCAEPEDSGNAPLQATEPPWFLGLYAPEQATVMADTGTAVAAPQSIVEVAACTVMVHGL